MRRVAVCAAEHLDETATGTDGGSESTAHLRQAAMDPGDDEIGQRMRGERRAQSVDIVVVADDGLDAGRDGADAGFVAGKDRDIVAALQERSAQAGEHSRAAGDERFHSAARFWVRGFTIQPPPRTRVPS